MLLLWVAALVILIAGAGLLSTGTNNTFAIPGTESQDALDALARTFPQVSGTSAQLIVVAPAGSDVREPAFQTAIESSIASIEKIPQVSSATSPVRLHDHGQHQSGFVGRAGPDPVVRRAERGRPMRRRMPSRPPRTDLRHALPAGSQVAMGGQLFAQTVTGISITELLGILIAFVVLIFTFGSFIAAGLPLVTALLGVGMSLAVIFIATRFAVITSTTPLLALMLGLAVGIDYALFIVSRHQDQVKNGIPPEESAARAIATAGSAVVFAAITVIIALVGLSVAHIPFLTTMGIAAALAVAMAVLISLTLTPALLGFIGMRVVAKRFRALPEEGAADADSGGQTDADPEAAGDPARDQAEDPAADALNDADARLEDEVGPDEPAVPVRPHPRPHPSIHVAASSSAGCEPSPAGPIVTVLAVVVLLGLLTIPAAHLRLALPDAGSLAADDPARVTYDLIAKHFGPGYNGPLIVTGSIIQSTDPVGLMDDLGTEIAAMPGVAAVPLSTPNETGDTGIVQVIPEGGPDSEQTKALVAEIRSMRTALDKKYGVDLAVTGYTAAGIDISARLAQALLPFGILVVGLSLVLLTMVFRSIVVPITAALGYLLSVGAAFGVTALVFEDGLLAGPLNVATLGPVISFMPIILMGVLFGLAMDYEVFLVSRMREDYVHHGDARDAVDQRIPRIGAGRHGRRDHHVLGLRRVRPAGDSSIKPIALGLAVGVSSTPSSCG